MEWQTKPIPQITPQRKYTVTQASYTSGIMHRSRRNQVVRIILAGLALHVARSRNISTDYSSEAGRYYSLLMGCEFKLARWSVLLDFENTADDASQSGIDLIHKLNVDQYRRPLSGGFPLHLLRRRATEGPHHLAHDDNVSGRHIQHGRQVQEQAVQLRP